MRGTMRGVMMTVLLASLALSSGNGCDDIYYTVSVNAAQSRLEQARQMGAEQQAPYEYYFAREHLRQAQLEASEASYNDATGYAENTELYAQKAIDVVQTGNRERKSGDQK